MTPYKGGIFALNRNRKWLLLQGIVLYRSFFSTVNTEPFESTQTWVCLYKVCDFCFHPKHRFVGGPGGSV